MTEILFFILIQRYYYRVLAEVKLNGVFNKDKQVLRLFSRGLNKSL